MSVVAGNGGSAPKLVYKMKLKRKCITSNLTTPRLLKKTTKKSKKKTANITTNFVPFSS